MRTVKQISLVALAALALTALASTATASASVFKAAPWYSATLEGTDVGHGPTSDILESFGGTWECNPPKFRSTSLKGPSSTLAVAEFKSTGHCWANPGSGEREIKMNGCTFAFHPGAPPSFAGTMDITCPEKAAIVIEDIYSSCDFSIEPKTGISTQYANVKGSVEITKLTGLTVKKFGCGGTVTNENASWSVDWNVVALNEAGGAEELQLGQPPVASYNFDENSGTTAHDSAGGHDGTVEGATWSSGKFNSALDFDGTNDLVSVPDASVLDLTGSFTLEAWIRPDSLTGARPVISKAAAGPNGYMLDAKTGAPRGQVASEGTLKAATSPSTVSTGEWSHLAVTSNGLVLRVYVNGELKAEAAAIGAAATTVPLVIGKGQLTGTWFDGRIDEVRLYDEVLNEAQIHADTLY